MDRPYNLLFLCTGNSARSIMAEAILRQVGGGRFRGYSAGSHPAGAVHPHTLELLERHRFPVDGLHSKHWDAFAGPDAPVMDFVLTVCDKAAGEACPVFFGPALKAHWGLADPSEQPGTDDEVEANFHHALARIERRCRAFFALPFSQLDAHALKRELDRIATL